MSRNATLAALLAVAVLLSFAVPIVAGAPGTSTATADNSTPTANPTATVGQSPTATPTPTTTPAASIDEQRAAFRDGPYGIEDLRDGGTEAVPDIDGVRALGEPTMGFAAVRYKDPSLFNAIFGTEAPWQELASTSTVQQNSVQLYGSAFGAVAGEYDLVIVYWQPKPMQVQTAAGNQTVEYAANQTVARQNITFGGDEVYSYNNVTLEPHYEQTYQATMWLERGGEPVGARWTFTHRSNPEARAVSIGSEADAWAYSMRNVGFPGIGGVIGGIILGRLTLRRTGRGPGYGIGAWLIIVSFTFAIVGGIAYYQIAVILQNFPQVMGLSIGVIAFAGTLTLHEPVRTIGFWRRELFDAITRDRGARATADGGQLEWGDGTSLGELFDELSEAVRADLPEVPVVRTGESYRVPVVGVRPFFARLFARAAEFDPQGIATRMKIDEGRLDDIIFVDPNSDEAVTHDPARIARALPWDTLRAQNEPEDITAVDEAWAAILSLGILVLPGAVGWQVFGNLFNIPVVGFLIGLVVTAIFAYSAEDGRLEFEAAPPHFKTAEDQLTVLQKAYKEAAEDQDAREEARTERAKTVKEARDDRDAEGTTIMDVLTDDADLPDGQPSGGGD